MLLCTRVPYPSARVPGVFPGRVQVSWERMHGRVTRLLSRLSEYKVVVRELIKAEDLSRLFDMLVSEIPAHNGHWRLTTATVLKSQFLKGFSEDAISDIRQTGCVPRCGALCPPIRPKAVTYHEPTVM